MVEAERYLWRIRADLMGGYRRVGSGGGGGDVHKAPCGWAASDTGRDFRARRVPFTCPSQLPFLVKSSDVGREQVETRKRETGTKTDINDFQ